MLFSRGYKRSMQSKVGRSAFKAFGGAKGSKQRYRLYADGTIYDQELGKVVGYMTENLDEIYRMRGMALQNIIREFLAKQ